MGSIVLIGGSVFVVFAMLGDPKTTLHAGVAIITIRGVTFLAKKITCSLNKDCSDIINMTGWCVAGWWVVKLIMNAKMGFVGIEGFINNANHFFENFSLLKMFNVKLY